MKTTLRSPLPWIGGKFYSARHILQAFPSPKSYDIYIELFGGAAHVFMQKPAFKHVEVYNDINNDLVNYWMHCRDHRQALEDRCRSLPYARSLYYSYHKSLFDGTQMDPLERAARWFYVLRSTFSGSLTSHVNGWSAGTRDAHSSNAQAYQSAVDLFIQLQQRLRSVMIDNRDFEFVLKQYDSPRTLVYADPPYVDHEGYYRADGSIFSLEDHQRLALCLGEARSYVALSYYVHPLVESLYSSPTWRRTTWKTFKHSQRTRSTRDEATELLLTNYDPLDADLWGSEVCE